MTEVTNGDSQSGGTSLLERVLLSLSAICTVLILGWVLWYSRYGIDFTDESFYLVWMLNPYNYKVSLSQFGFVYHPLYELLDGNVAALRQANILLTYSLSWVLCNVFLKTVFGMHSLPRVPRIILAGGIATASFASLIFAGLWLPTPSYNSLALQALLVAAIGLLLANKDGARASIIGWVLIGTGGCLAFMAKPTTAAALGLCAAFYLLLAGKLRIRMLAISVATAVGFLGISAFAIDGSLVVFVFRLKDGVEMAGILGGGYTLAEVFRLDDFDLGEKAKLFLIYATAFIFFAAYFSQANVKALVRGSAMLSLMFALVILVMVFGLTREPRNIGRLQGLLICSVPFAVMLTVFPIYRFKGIFRISCAQWGLAVTFLVLPYVYAFGTGNSYWVAGALAGIFWVLGGFVFLSPMVSGKNFLALLLTFGLSVQMITAVLVHAGLEAPYRQPQPLRENDSKLEFGKPGAELVLSHGYARYIEAAVSLTNQAEFKKGTPMIDLSGQSPGILYAIGASNIGQAWTIGGYPGSDKLAVEMLKRVSCEQLARAWLLTEPDGPIKISPEILASFGSNLYTDFGLVGSIETAEGAGGHEKARVQQLLKPIRGIDVAMMACAATRGALKQ